MSRPDDLKRFAVYPSLRGRVVLVTGGASGIGADVVRGFAHQGARVAFFDIAEDAGNALVDRLKGEGVPPTHFRRVDLKDIAALKAGIEGARTALGPIEVLVNNAANDDRHEIGKVTSDYWDDRMAVNLKHQFFCAQAVIGDMEKAGKGAIVNLSSISWHVGLGGMPAYVTAKAAIAGLTRTLARDLGPKKIRVNSIVPGSIMTERQKKLWLSPEYLDQVLANQCLKDTIDPVHIANMALWLASDDAERCTGRDFFVDAGWL
ncbi:MAG: SDR family oxidoreductase [Alphaproteobacteria bacterium]|nr:SDR family oxidoreductase [Alphaproteobacteria bacterium]